MNRATDEKDVAVKASAVIAAKATKTKIRASICKFSELQVWWLVVVVMT